jgi:hypothetical protein
MDECPAIRANVKASHPESPSRVIAVWRKQYGSNGFNSSGFLFLIASALIRARARACWPFAELPSKWPQDLLIALASNGVRTVCIEKLDRLVRAVNLGLKSCPGV